VTACRGLDRGDLEQGARDFTGLTALDESLVRRAALAGGNVRRVSKELGRSPMLVFALHGGAYDNDPVCKSFAQAIGVPWRCEAIE
jgi:hypothetical protein